MSFTGPAGDPPGISRWLRFVANQVPPSLWPEFRCAFSFAVFGEVARKAKLPGLLVPVGGLIQVSAPQHPPPHRTCPPGQAQALLSATQTSEPLCRVSVRLSRQEIVTYGEVQHLKAGMVLDAEVLPGTRAVWDWMLEPVLAIAGSVGSPPSSSLN